MFPEANCLTPPGRLLEYLDDNSALGLRYRQRAVLTKHADDTWHVVCSAMQSFSPAIGIPTGKASFWYERAGFFECWYDAAQCRQFIDEVQRGKLQFDKVSIARNVGANWQSEIFSANNMYMSDAGLVAHTRFETVGASMNVDALMAKGRPYYSNAEDAAREWLPFADYHGHGDGRNGEVLFLLPQFRAHFTSVCWTAGALKICVSGSDVGRDLTLLVKGNYRIGRSTAHFERAVKAGQVSVEVAQDAQRAEAGKQRAAGAVEDEEDRQRGCDRDLLLGQAPFHDARRGLRRASRARKLGDCRRQAPRITSAFGTVATSALTLRA